MNIQRNKLFVALTMCFGSLVVTADQAQAKQGKDVLGTVTVIGKDSDKTDEQGYDNIYDNNVSSDYKGIEEIEAFQINSVGDVLTGLNNVYNMSTRTSGSAITPNIRGISGKGRIPVTIDGTEQTVDVWLKNYGVGDRNYLDPALFRSIKVEKGPALTRGVKSGVGGSVSIETINPTDIIPEGKSWGIKARMGFSNNSAKPEANLDDYLGWPDYRTIPGGATADGAGGGLEVVGQDITLSPKGLIIDEFPKPRKKTYKFGDDKKFRLAAAFDNDLTDGIIAYSYRKKGNYFAGKKGADAYKNNPIFKSEFCWREEEKNKFACYSSASFIPNIAGPYKPGEEVFNSSTETKSLLLKNSWKLPKNQKIGWQYMNTKIEFGEIPPDQMSWMLRGYDNNSVDPNLTDKKRKEIVYQVPSIKSKIDTDTLKLSYDWQPQDNPLIDFKASVAYVKTESRRHQSGGMSLGVLNPDEYHDAWVWVNKRAPKGYIVPDEVQNTINELKNWWGVDLKGMSKEDLYKLPFYGIMELRPGEKPDPKKCARYKDKPYTSPLCQGYNVFAGSLQKTTATRIIGDVSNYSQLSDNLGLTIHGDFQYEELEQNHDLVKSNGFVDMYGLATTITKNQGPRSASRRIWGADAKLDWQATDKLNITAGLRYEGYSAIDDVREIAKAENDLDQAFPNLGRYTQMDPEADNPEYTDGLIMPMYELVENKQLIEDYNQLGSDNGDIIDSLAGVNNDAPLSAFIKKHNINYDPEVVSYLKGKSKPSFTYVKDKKVANDYSKKCNDNPGSKSYCHLYRVRYQYSPIRAHKVDNSRLKIKGEGMMAEKVVDPTGRTSDKLNKYLPGERYNKYKRKVIDSPGWAIEVKKPITDELHWITPARTKGHAWAPMLAVTYDITDNHRVFARIAQKTRFPSLYEVTSREGSPLFTDMYSLPEPLKPERSTNWEIGYSLNFSPYFNALKIGDMRLTYYHNTIKNVLDTNISKGMTQYDKKINSGLELQARADTGKYYANLGVSYRMKQKMCDANGAASLDLVYQRIPECIEGGFGGTRFHQSLQPKYSVNADVGARLLDKKLKMGLRATYHSGPKIKQYDDLVSKGVGNLYDIWSSGRPYHWKPALVLDAYAHYRLNKNFNVNFGVTNLTDRYYLDPMAKVPTPGPGRTFTLGFEGRF